MYSITVSNFVNMTLYIHRPYTYIASKYNIYLYELCKQEEKRVFGKLFKLFLGEYK